MNNVTFIPNFCNEELYDQLYNELDWTYHNYFKRHFCKYAGNSPTLDMLIKLVEVNLNTNVISVFANLYKNGGEYAPYHKDSYNCTVVSLTFGAARDFYFKHDKTGKRHHYLLDNGALLMFEDAVNKNYKHSVPIRKKCDKPRICLTMFAQ